METFTGFIEDDRYSTPTVMFFMAKGQTQARKLADRDLSANPHHRTFEVRDGQDRLIFIAARDQGRSTPSLQGRQASDL